MKKLDNYIDYIFSDYPENKEITEIKKELKYNLEQRIDDYKNDGLSETIAIQKAIDSVGDINELMESYGVDVNLDQYQSSVDEYSEMLLKHDNLFKEINPKNALLIALAIFILLITLGITGTVSAYRSIDSSNMITILTFFIGVLIAVPIFIYCGFRAEKYNLNKIDYTDEEIETFEKDKQVIKLKKQLKQSYNIDTNKHNIFITIGISLCIFAVAIAGIIATGMPEREGHISIIFFSLTAIGVFLIVYHAMMKEYSPATTSLIKVRNEGKIGAIIMPIAVIIFLILGLIFNLWHPGWIVFPIGGILIGVISSIQKK